MCYRFAIASCYRGAMVWGRASREKGVVERFVSALNAHDTDGVAALLTEDFIYIDSWREGVSGRDLVMEGLRKLVSIDPGFGIEVDRMDWRDPCVLMSGRVNSSQFGSGRRAVWQVTMRDGKLAQYQAWAEGGPPPMSRILSPDLVRNMADKAQDRPDISG